MGGGGKEGDRERVWRGGSEEGCVMAILVILYIN